ncbi:MAG: alpha/beta hydrolase [Beijerinckiaceae bacterium]|nr:alpha/beta hydrolase [Beijerinckiaceae bacterium]
MTEQLDLLLSRFAATTGAWTPDTPLAAMRAGLDGIFTAYPLVPGTRVLPQHGDMEGEWVEAPGVAQDRAMLLIHGGGFSMGSARAHRAYASHLSAACDLRVFTADYRLVPEHIFPAAHDDCLAAWDFLVGTGIKPRDIVVCGDSAGGGLALSLAIALRDSARAGPGSLILVSPWADMTAAGESYSDPAIDDPVASREMTLAMAAAYLGPADPRDPRASPVYADLSAMPPLLIIVGSREVFLDEARTIARGVKDHGGESRLEVWPGMIHQFPLHVGALDEATGAIDQIGAFARGRFG